MTASILISDETPSYDWTEASSNRIIFGSKGAMLATLPRPWTPPFILVSAATFSMHRNGEALLALGDEFARRVRVLGAGTGGLMVRSSVVGESIWDRGTYRSVVVSGMEGFERMLCDAATEVLASAPSKQVALVIQSYVPPKSRGEFGNVLRISKTRDQWELTTETSEGATSRVRLNAQRDEAADSGKALIIRARQSRERLFGSVAAWLNNELLRGRSQRLNSEWLTDNKQFYLVQLDEEDEDFSGVNPFQIQIAPFHKPTAARGRLLRHADRQSLGSWDKLQVLEDLWETGAAHKPVLFVVPCSELVGNAEDLKQKLEADFGSMIGRDDVVVRTSVRSGSEKLPNLPRTECLRPDRAAEWCVEKIAEFLLQGHDLTKLAFVSHRFIAARASAWVRAELENPIVEIHGLWGLPDALQYCPYDIWEVHSPTEVATEYPDYKSHMLIARGSGRWEYVRVKNELARHLSIGRRDAIDLAARTSSIARRIGKACHVMWFVGCVDSDGTQFNLPWYWTDAHAADHNVDRSNYTAVSVSDRAALGGLGQVAGGKAKLAIELQPTDLNLMRDTKFIESVGAKARELGIPVILSGSTLAHAYYQLRRTGCTVVARGEKEHSRVRHASYLGKLVRDKIPARIVERQESEVTKKVPAELVKRFLISKLLEEAMEIRGAQGGEQKTVELADLYEVFRALARAEGIPIEKIIAKADEKKKRVGGFDEGLVLLQTGIMGLDRSARPEGSWLPTQVLASKNSENSCEIPFSFFGFMEFDQPRSLIFDNLGIRVDVVLKTDRVELSFSRAAEQFELPLDLSVNPSGPSEE